MISYADGCMRLSGQLTMDTVPALYAQGLQHLDKDGLVLDFAAVESADSSAVSLLLAWMRAAKEKNRAVRVINLPPSMLSLAGLYGVAELLPVQAG